MNASRQDPAKPPRPVTITVGAVLLAEAIALAMLLAHTRLMLPVTTTARPTNFAVTTVDVGAGAIVPVVLGAAILLSGAVADGRVRWLESSFSASITVFLIAELNGIQELGTLVAIYALTSAAVLFGVLHQRRIEPRSRLAGLFGAMVGVVPWGLIAWYQLAPLVADGAGPAVWVRVLTVGTLLLFVAAAVVAWRAGTATEATPTVETRPVTPISSIVLGVITRSIVAWTIVVAVATGSTIS